MTRRPAASFRAAVRAVGLENGTEPGLNLAGRKAEVDETGTGNFRRTQPGSTQVEQIDDLLRDGPGRLAHGFGQQQGKIRGQVAVLRVARPFELDPGHSLTRQPLGNPFELFGERGAGHQSFEAVPPPEAGFSDGLSVLLSEGALDVPLSFSAAFL